MNDIPEVALRTIEDIFGTSFVRHAADEAELDAGQPFASVFPETAAEVESLTKLAAHHRIPLIARLSPWDRPLCPAARSSEVRALARRSRSSSASWWGGDPGNGCPDGRGGASDFRPGQWERRTCRPVRHYRHRIGAASWPLLDARASVKGSGRGSRPRAWYEGTCRLRIQRLGGSRDD
jgi:hypothetical protein